MKITAANAVWKNKKYAVTKKSVFHTMLGNMGFRSGNVPYADLKRGKQAQFENHSTIPYKQFKASVRQQGYDEKASAPMNNQGHVVHTYEHKNGQSMHVLSRPNAEKPNQRDVYGLTHYTPLKEESAMSSRIGDYVTGTHRQGVLVHKDEKHAIIHGETGTYKDNHPNGLVTVPDSNVTGSAKNHLLNTRKSLKNNKNFGYECARNAKDPNEKSKEESTMNKVEAKLNTLTAAMRPHKTVDDGPNERSVYAKMARESASDHEFHKKMIGYHVAQAKAAAAQVDKLDSLGTGGSRHEAKRQKFQDAADRHALAADTHLKFAKYSRPSAQKKVVVQKTVVKDKRPGPHDPSRRHTGRISQTFKNAHKPRI